MIDKAQKEAAILRFDFLHMLDELEAALKMPPKDGYQRRTSHITLEDECDGVADFEDQWDIEQADIDMLRAAVSAACVSTQPEDLRELTRYWRTFPAPSNERAAADIIDRLASELGTLDAEVARLEALVYVPGVWKCAKCKLSLISSTLNASSGQIKANNEPQQCPNGCGPLWRKTERDAGNELIDRMDQTWNNVVERAAKECERQIDSDEARGRLQARSVLTRCAAAIRGLALETAPSAIEPFTPPGVLPRYAAPFKMVGDKTEWVQVRFVPREHIHDKPTEANPSPIRVIIMHELESAQQHALAFNRSDGGAAAK